MALFGELQDELDERAAKGLLRSRRTVSGPQATQLLVDGKPYLSFCSNDYLGLANHPQLIEALQQGAAEFGVGAGAAHLVNGHFSSHEQLETELAAFVGKPAALLYSTGYMANLGVVQALTGRGDTVFADKLNHASLNDAMLLSRAEVKRYRHNDMAQLASLLEKTTSGRKLICTDAVFSMDGDLLDVQGLGSLKEEFGFFSVVDEAHAFGVLGEQGCGLARPVADIAVGTFGKASGLFGAFVLLPETVKEYLVSKEILAGRIDAEGKGESQPITRAGECKGAKSAKMRSKSKN